MIYRCTTVIVCVVAVLCGPVIAEVAPISFEMTEIGALTDPTGLFTDEEVEQGGSDRKSTRLNSSH